MTSPASTDTSASPGYDLRERWDRYREENPRTRIRYAADDLGVSEAELIATGCGDTVTRLNGPWHELVDGLEALGPVMALTRNDHAVHEKTGVYREVSHSDGHDMGLVLDDDIDLRIFYDHWHFGFAVSGDHDGGDRPSLRFFDRDGTAVHKVYLTDDSDRDAFDRLVDAHRHADASPRIEVEPYPPSDPETPDTEIDVEGFLEEWRGLQDTHDFFPLLRDYDVSRTQALRFGEGEFTRRVSAESFRHTLQRSTQTDTPIMVFVGSPGTLQIHTGPVESLRETGPWYNVLDDGFHLHVREPAIAQAWVVRKPTEDGDVHSLELIDEDGDIIARLFGKRKPGLAELDAWRTVVHSLE